MFGLGSVDPPLELLVKLRDLDLLMVLVPAASIDALDDGVTGEDGLAEEEG